MSGLEPVIWFEARKPERFAAVKSVADDGEPGVTQVNTDLVHAADERFALQERIAATGKCFQHFKLGLRFLAVFRVHAHQPGFDRIDRKSTRLNSSHLGISYA